MWDIPRSQTYKNKELAVAIHWGSVEKAKQWIRRGADVNCRDATDGTLLHVACQRNTASVALLLRQGADVDAWANGQQPLHSAAEREEDEDFLVYMLLLYNANPNAPREVDQATPLHIACLRGHLRVLNAIVLSRRDGDEAMMNAVNKDGQTPLFLACWHGHKSVVEYLLSHSNVNINIRSKDGLTIVHAACRSGLLLELTQIPRMQQFLEETANATDSQGRTPLHMACLYQGLPTVKYLVEHAKANVHPLTNDGQSVLDLACQKAENHDVIYYFVRECAFWNKFNN